MRQTLHIFLKDVRRLRLELIALLAIFIAWIITGEQPLGLRSALNRLLLVVLPCACVFLVVLLIQEEAPVGNRQFWLTRPYRRTHLLAAKLLFILLFLTAPWLLADYAMLHLNGLPLHDASSLLWRLAGVLIIFVLPAAAVASVTRDIRQFGLAALLALVAVAFAPDWMGGAWRTSARWCVELLVLLTAAAGAATVLVRQYRTRSTARSWVVLLVTLALLGLETRLPLDWAFRLTAALWPGPAALEQIRVTRSTGGRPPFTGLFGRTPMEEAVIPLEFSGVPAGLQVEVEEATSVVRTRNGRAPKFTTTVETPRGELWLQLSWPRAELPAETKPVVDVRARVYLTVLHPDPPAALRAGDTHLLAGGDVRCLSFRGVSRTRSTTCRSAFFIPGAIRYELPESGAIRRTRPAPPPLLATVLGPDPVASDTLFTNELYEPRLVLWRPVGRLVRDIEIRGLNLWDYSRDNPGLEPERVR